MRTMAWRTRPPPSIVSPLRSARKGQSAGARGGKLALPRSSDLAQRPALPVPENSCNSKLKSLDRAFPSTVLTALRNPLFRPHENRTQSRVPTERGVVRCVRANKGDGPAADGATTERMAPFQGTTPKPVSIFVRMSERGISSKSSTGAGFRRLTSFCIGSAARLPPRCRARPTMQWPGMAYDSGGNRRRPIILRYKWPRTLALESD